MSLDRNSPASAPLTKVGAFGNPYHGTVQGGTLTLPNAITKTWPQPDSTTPDIAGSTHLLMRPGQPEVVRSIEQAAADTAAGLQWRNKAMLSGGKLQLYGKNIGGWIYIDPSGGRWRIEFVTPLESIVLGFAATLSLQMRVSRFGSFGGSDLTFTTTLTLTDWGQTGYPTLRDFPVTGPSENVTAAEFFLEAVTPTGSRAAISAHELRTNSSLTSDPSIDVAVRHALGWVEISITLVGGLPSLSLSVLKNRAQTLGVIQNSVVTTANADIVLPPLIVGGGNTTIKTSDSRQLLEFNRLIAVWVNPVTEEWRWVSLRYFYDLRGISSSLGAAGNVHTSRLNVNATEFVALQVDGVERSRIEVGSVSSENMTGKYTGTDPDVRIEVQRQPRTTTLTLDGVTYSETGVAGPVSIGNAGVGALINISNVTASFSGSFVSNADAMAIAFQVQWRNQTRLSLALPEPNQIYIDLCRQSGQVLCQRLHVVSQTLNEFTYFPRVTPGGLSGSKITGAYSASERFFGSWCPHTGAVRSMETVPVCWV